MPNPIYEPDRKRYANTGDAQVTLRAKKDYTFNLSFPGKTPAMSIEFKKLNKEDEYFTAIVPTVVYWTNWRGEQKVYHPNYAQHLIDNYDGIEVLEVKEREVIKAPVVSPKQKKEIKHEKASP